ncbi:hypothetical protein Bhyg_04335 [Pseudolycoriella hygida]|uniref:Uncharacterized protein n=1 Tax=Pseudolycoriella hygida TaxID=35572 RepID=A0A9Q0S8C3_9DIPT|nr:hypothetical protein Bhyg_04335 [Pseudolycoriella hygida]
MTSSQRSQSLKNLKVKELVERLAGLALVGDIAKAIAANGVGQTKSTIAPVRLSSIPKGIARAGNVIAKVAEDAVPNFAMK